MNKKSDTKMKLRKGDNVLIIAGADKGKTGLIERVIPNRNRIVVAGINMVKKNLKRSYKNPGGGIIDFAAPIHASNAMILDPSTNKPARIGYKVGKEKDRISKVSGEEVKGAK